MTGYGDQEHKQELEQERKRREEEKRQRKESDFGWDHIHLGHGRD